MKFYFLTNIVFNFSPPEPYSKNLESPADTIRKICCIVKQLNRIMDCEFSRALDSTTITQ